MSRRDRSLYRDTSDKMIAGVCSGLGLYFDVDTALVRVAFVVFTLLGGAGVLAYLVLWFALNPGPTNLLVENQTDPAVLPEDLTEPEIAPEVHSQSSDLQSDGLVENGEIETSADYRSSNQGVDER